MIRPRCHFSVFAAARVAVALLAIALPGLHAADKAAAPVKAAAVSTSPGLKEFQEKISPILQQHCYECHGDGAKKAGVAFDELTTEKHLLQNPEFWLKVLRNTRSRVMPPADVPAPTAEQQQALERWITTSAFGLNPVQPDPGRVTVRRLNRTEYRNTLRDLIGVDFDVDSALPPDDVGYGFDNIGDVLSISPMRMEKFIEAAMAAAQQGVPQDTVTMGSQMALPGDFKSAEGSLTGDRMSFYEVNKVSFRFRAKAPGEYRIHMAVKVDGSARPDPQMVKVKMLSEGEEFFQQDYRWSDAEYFDYEKVVRWEAGDREVSFVTQPLKPELKPLPARMDFRILYVRVEGPLDRKHWEHPVGYKRFYDREAPPTDAKERRAYAREVLARFVPKAFRRPVTDDAIDRLVDLAEKTYSVPGTPFEKGISQAIVAALASPRFIFHLERTEPLKPGEAYPRVDEYTLASRLSYTLWSSLPDEELTQLAARGELRKNFRAQVQRMLADPKAQAFAENFSGQWLQSRGVLDIQINSAEVMAHDGPVAPPAPALAPAPAEAVAAVVTALAPAAAAADAAGAAVVAVAAAGDTPRAAGAPGAPGRGARGGRGRGGPTIPPGTVLTPEIRKAMKQETEAYFAHIVRENRSILELLQSDYTFVNEPLAAVYGLPDITGADLRRVTLPPGNLRGGVLTMGSILTVTSNPTRTSPVKRGKWILENILGAPPAPPPPDIPALEETQAKVTDRKPTQRELLAIHRAEPLCASCHSRMDPLGLALENFNAFGRGRTQENGVPIDPAGELATGEKFSSVLDLKRTLVDQHRIEFYRTITEKLLTYALGRGVEYYDVPTVDRIVAQLEKEDGRFSTLLFGVLESAPFQQRRPTPNQPTADLSSVSPHAQIASQ